MTPEQAGTRWDEVRHIWVCDRTERTHLPPHCTSVILGGMGGVVLPPGFGVEVVGARSEIPIFRFTRADDHES